MMDDRLFALVALLCLLFWLLARERRIPAGLRRWLELAAYAGLALGLAIALLQFFA
jgi:4-amino-4-deoxy-L-arabinose transferase-like glycosyltransferase